MRNNGPGTTTGVAVSAVVDDANWVTFDPASTSARGCALISAPEGVAFLCRLGSLRPKQFGRATIELRLGRAVQRKDVIRFVVVSPTRDTRRANNNIDGSPELTGCADSYPTICVTEPPPNLNCATYRSPTSR